MQINPIVTDGDCILGDEGGSYSSRPGAPAVPRSRSERGARVGRLDPEQKQTARNERAKFRAREPRAWAGVTKQAVFQLNGLCVVERMYSTCARVPTDDVTRSSTSVNVHVPMLSNLVRCGPTFPPESFDASHSCTQRFVCVMASTKRNTNITSSYSSGGLSCTRTVRLETLTRDA